MIEFTKNICLLLKSFDIKYLIIGGVAQIFYKQKEVTKDLDILILDTKENLENLNCIIKNDKIIGKFKNNKILRISGKPYSIDFHLKLDGLKLENTFKNTNEIKKGNFIFNVITENELKINLSTTKSNIYGNT